MRWSDRYCLGFINALKTHPCLYDRVSLEFYNDELRDKAYRKLLSRVRRRYPLFTKEDVKRRVRSLRYRYRTEQEKVEKGRALGIAYRPRMRHFRVLDFLKEERVQEQVPRRTPAERTVPTRAEVLQSPLGRTLTARRAGEDEEVTTRVNRTSSNIKFCADFIVQMEQLPENVALLLQKLAGEALFLARTGALNRFSRCLAPGRGGGEEDNSPVVPLRKGDDEDQDYSGFCFYLEEELEKLPDKAALNLTYLLQNCLFMAKKGRLNTESMIVTGS